MKESAVVILMSLAFLACSNEDPQQGGREVAETPKTLTNDEKLEEHLSSIDNKQDTILLGFVLGSSKRQVNNHINKLIEQGKIGQKTTLANNIIELTGYPYILAPEKDSKFEGLLAFSFLDGKLFQIDFQVYEGYKIMPATLLLREKYGRENIDRTWWRNNTEITITNGERFGDIIYRDLSRGVKLKAELEAEKKQQDSTMNKNAREEI